MSLGTLALIGICGLCGPLLSAGLAARFRRSWARSSPGCSSATPDSTRLTPPTHADLPGRHRLRDVDVQRRDARPAARRAGAGVAGPWRARRRCRRGPRRRGRAAGLEDRSDGPPRGIRGADRFGVSRGGAPGGPGASAAWRSRADRDRSSRGRGYRRDDRDPVRARAGACRSRGGRNASDRRLRDRDLRARPFPARESGGSCAAATEQAPPLGARPPDRVDRPVRAVVDRRADGGEPADRRLRRRSDGRRARRPEAALARGARRRRRLLRAAFLRHARGEHRPARPCPGSGHDRDGSGAGRPDGCGPRARSARHRVSRRRPDCSPAPSSGYPRPSLPSDCPST